MQPPVQPTPTLRGRVYEVLEDEEWPHPASRWINRALVALILLSVVAAVLGTVAEIDREWSSVLGTIEVVCVGLFTIEYGLRVWASVEDRAGRYEHPLWGRLRYMATPMALIDLVAILPTWLAGLLPGDFLLLRTLRILRVLKITRYSPALATFEIVLVNERRSLLAAATILAVALCWRRARCIIWKARCSPTPSARSRRRCGGRSSRSPRWATATSSRSRPRDGSPAGSPR